MLSSTELREQLTSGLDDLSAAEAHEEFSERLDNFLEQNNIEESEIISGESEYAPILSEAAFNDLNFRGMEGTGLSLADARRMMTDDDYRLEMAEDYLTGNAEARIENEYTEYSYNNNSRLGLPRAEPLSDEGVEAVNEAVRTKEFMHYEMRDTLNLEKGPSPKILEDFYEADDSFEWQQMLGDQAAFHQNGGADDLKFIHPDGRELVFDGDTKELMTAENNNDQHMGTYNYSNATVSPVENPGIVETIRNATTEGSSLHDDLDIQPWIEMGNTRADRDAHGGEEARQAQFNGALFEGGVNSLDNDIDDAKDWASEKVDQAGEVLSDAGEAVSDKAGEVRDAVSDKVDEAGDAIHHTFEDLKSFGKGLWQEGALNPDYQNMNGQNMNGTHIQSAALSETVLPTSSGTVYLEDAIGMLAADHNTLNVPTTDEQASPIRDALNHPDAAQMFQNLHTHGVKALTAEIAPDMSAEDRVRELLLAGQEATQEAGIPMPSEQRELEATQELNNNYEDDYSLGV